MCLRFYGNLKFLKYPDLLSGEEDFFFLLAEGKLD